MLQFEERDLKLIQEFLVLLERDGRDAREKGFFVEERFRHAGE